MATNQRRHTSLFDFDMILQSSGVRTIQNIDSIDTKFMIVISHYDRCDTSLMMSIPCFTTVIAKRKKPSNWDMCVCVFPWSYINSLKTH